MSKPIAFCSFEGYRRFCLPWWNELLDYCTGIDCRGALFYRDIETRRVEFRVPGWCRDIYTYWHRARYGWAPRDTWSLNTYLNNTFAGTLHHLAEHTHSCPHEYCDETAPDNHCHRWESTLRRWAAAFSECPDDVDIYDREQNYRQHNAEETRRRENIHTALKEIEPLWDSLWD